MTKKEAINCVKGMNLSNPVIEALTEMIVDLDYDSYMAGYCQGYDDGVARKKNEYY